MCEQVADSHPLAGHIIVEPEIGQVSADVRVPVEQLLVYEHTEQRGGKRLRDRSDGEEGAWCDGKPLVEITKAVALGQDDFAVCDHRDGEAGDLPVLHEARDERIDVAQPRGIARDELDETQPRRRRNRGRLTRQHRTEDQHSRTSSTHEASWLITLHE